MLPSPPSAPRPTNTVNKNSLLHTRWCPTCKQDLTGLKFCTNCGRKSHLFDASELKQEFEKHNSNINLDGAEGQSEEHIHPANKKKMQIMSAVAYTVC